MSGARGFPVGVEEPSDLLLRATGHRRRLAADSSAPPRDVCETAIKRDDADRLQASLALLPHVQREVISLAYYGQLSHTEIATRLDLPAGTVKGRMRLGLQRLRASTEWAVA